MSSPPAKFQRMVPGVLARLYLTVQPLPCMRLASHQLSMEPRPPLARLQPAQILQCQLGPQRTMSSLPVKFQRMRPGVLAPPYLMAQPLPSMRQESHQLSTKPRLHLARLPLVQTLRSPRGLRQITSSLQVLSLPMLSGAQLRLFPMGLPLLFLRPVPLVLFLSRRMEQ